MSLILKNNQINSVLNKREKKKKKEKQVWEEKFFLVKWI